MKWLFSLCVRYVVIDTREFSRTYVLNVVFLNKSNIDDAEDQTTDEIFSWNRDE